jgi:streptogramin lyase
VPALALAPRHAPPGHLQLNAFGIAPPRAGFDKQWTVGPIVPWQHGGVVMWLDRGAMNLAGSIGFVSRDGQMTTVPIGKDIIPPRPPSPVPGLRVPPLRMQPRVDWPPKATTIVYDTSGNVWFNNVWDPSIWRLDSSGRVTSTLVGVRTPPFRGGLAIRLALGPDGQAWFARSHPTKEIARADGSASITIPDRFGDALILARAAGGFWFVSQTQLVDGTLSGAFTATPLPAQLQNVRTYPGLRVASAGDSIWIANGAYIARMNERGVLAHYELPDATLGVYTMVTGCDGSLYVAENAPEVLRLPPGGKSLERYPIRYRQLDGLTSTSDCTIWFVEGTGMPGGEQGVGTLQLIR